MNKVNEEKKKQNEMESNQGKFDFDAAHNDTKTLKQKNLISSFDVQRDNKKLEMDLIKFKSDESNGWRHGDQDIANTEYKKSEHALNEAHYSESQVRRQQNLRSCLESADD